MQRRRDAHPEPQRHSPWGTTLVRVLGPSHLTSEQVAEFEKRWPQSGNA
ncbi:hypothetical protein P376_1247 [Streptomyces sp. HCCB10043]|nr:hypothetical protein P376_1247 [Streptomyces sp. HCCB10043]